VTGRGRAADAEDGPAFPSRTDDSDPLGRDTVGLYSGGRPAARTEDAASPPQQFGFVAGGTLGHSHREVGLLRQRAVDEGDESHPVRLRGNQFPETGERKTIQDGLGAVG